MAEPGVNPEAEGVRLQQALDATRPDLQEAATAAHAKAWLGPYLRTQEGTRQLYSLLQQHVSKDAFLKQLTRARSQLSSASCVTEVASAGQGEVLQPNGGWWQVPANEQTAHEPTCLELVEPDELSTPRSRAEDYLASIQKDGDNGGGDSDEETLSDSWVVVERSDVLEAIGQFVAAYLATMPEAQHLQPKQLQAALTQTFKELRKGRVRQMWDWGKGLYRVGAVTYSAFSLYTNPWLVRAVVAAIWTASKVLTGFVF